jgi:NADPH-dependent 2,4-dienoyl-CoA reductase/sulfur reductase-like enzyme
MAFGQNYHGRISGTVTDSSGAVIPGATIVLTNVETRVTSKFQTDGNGYFIIPNLPGIDREKVISGVDLLLGKKEAGPHTVIVGGGLAGCEIAIWLAQNGKKSTIVEMLPQLMIAGVMVPYQVKQMILDLLDVNEIEVIRNAQVTEVTQEGVFISPFEIPPCEDPDEIAAGIQLLKVGKDHASVLQRYIT